MAELNVERKGGPGIWLWVVLLVIIAIAAWVLYGVYGGRSADDTATTTAVGAPQPSLGNEPANTTLYVHGFIPEGVLVEVELDAVLEGAE